MSRRKGVSESSQTFKASSSTNLLLGACYFVSFHSKPIQLSQAPLDCPVSAASVDHQPL